MRNIFLIYILLIISFAGVSQDYTLQSCDSSSLKVLSWNIYMLPNPANPKNKLTRAHIIADFLCEETYDIIVLQEAFDFRARNIIAAHLKEKYPYRIGPGNARNFSFKTNSGIWILSKFPLTIVKEIDFNNCQGIDCLSRKGALMVEGNYNDHLFQLVGTHLESGGSDRIRIKQYKEIKNLLLEPAKKLGVPQIICGDFNTEMGDKVNYTLMKEILNVDEFNLCGEIQYSSDGITNDLKTYSSDRSIIDYIFLRRNGFNIKKIKTYINAFTKSWKRGHDDLSDHYAVIAEIGF